MKYVSLDIETTSLIPNPDHILMVSMVIEDTKTAHIPVEELPHFTCFVKHDEIKGQPYALGMNGWILDYLSGRVKNPPYPIYSSSEDGWIALAYQFLNSHFRDDKINVAGKNVAGFDLQFLPKGLKSLFRHRVLDPGTLFIDWEYDDQVPDFAKCKETINLKTPVAHDAREDAMDIIRLFRTQYYFSK